MRRQTPTPHWAYYDGDLSPVCQRDVTQHSYRHVQVSNAENILSVTADQLRVETI